jgi:hypothetical protein
MKERIDRDSPVPLYHQIAEALRNAIAVGEFAPGARLPAVRDAAEQWGVNLHTVRRAYGDLAREGLVEIGGAQGTRVGAVGGGVAGRGGDLDAFLSQWVAAAGDRFGLTQLQLGQVMLKRAASSARPEAHVIECSAEQAAGHARELMSAWQVDAKPFVLSGARELPSGRNRLAFGMNALPSGVLVGTYFHYNDIRQRWPDRLDEVRFVAIAPDPALAGEVAARDPGRARRLLVCEFDESKALNIAADLKNVFQDGAYGIEPRVLTARERLPEAGAGDVLLVSPRVWGALTEHQRTRVVPIRYRIRAGDLEALGIDMGWDRAHREEALA